jgi:hypothetical protein
VAGIVPEGFIWHVLASATDALAHLYYGFRTAGEMLVARKGTYGARPHDYGWVPTAHRAVHMDRIYLTAEGTAGLANEYPRIMLGDFNECIRKVDSKTLHIVIIGRAIQRPVLQTQHDVDEWWSH